MAAPLDETKIDVSGEMEVPQAGGQKFQFDLQNLTKLQNLPTPLEILQWTRRSLRPWTEFFNTANFKTAVSMPRLSSRFVRNIKHFQSNYIFVFFVLMLYCLVTSPLVLFVLAGSAFCSHKLKQSDSPITIFGQQLSTKQQIIAVNIAALPVLFLVGAGSILFWSLGACCFLVALHATFYNIDAIVTEDTDSFLSEVV